jgi:hypothetical protein
MIPREPPPNAFNKLKNGRFASHLEEVTIAFYARKDADLILSRLRIF